MIEQSLSAQIKVYFNQVVRWLMPGLGFKRWILVILLGTTLIAVGISFLLLDIYRTTSGAFLLPILSTASLRFLPRVFRAMIFGGLGLGILALGIWGMNRALMTPFVQAGKPVVDTIARFRRKERGPRIVVIGGGTGLSTMLRGLKAYTNNLTAIVTVADDGGSSGRLRRSLGILPPGDIRNCLAALSNDEALMSQLFQYRFANGVEGMDGHSFGNLFISAMTEITGSFEEAVAESGRVLSIYGRVLPATLHDVKLVADVLLPHEVNEVRIEGGSLIPEASGNIRRVWLEPNNSLAFPQAIQEILGADLVVVGPGSLYTSILPNLLVPDIANALKATQAIKIFVCNVATQPGETEGYNCGDHLYAIESHVGGEDLFDIVLCNQSYDKELPDDAQWVLPEDDFEASYPVYFANVVDDERPWRHDAERLAKVLIDLLQERTGPLAL